MVPGKHKERDFYGKILEYPAHCTLMQCPSTHPTIYTDINSYNASIIVSAHTQIDKTIATHHTGEFLFVHFCNNHFECI